MPVTTDDQPGPRTEEELQFEDRTADGDPTVDGAVRFVSDDLVVKTAGGVKSLTAAAGGGEINTGANVGTGQGNVFRDKTSVTLNFKRLAAGPGIKITDGADEIAVEVDKDRLRFFDDFVGWRINNRVWQTQLSGAGSAIRTPAGARIGGQIRLRSGGAAGRSAELSWNNRRNVSAAKNAVLECRIQVEDLANSYREFGLAYFGANNEQVYLGSDASGNWRAESQSGGATTSVDTGVAATAAWVILRIELTSTDCKFYIDGSLVATITANLPTADALQFLAYQETTGGGANRDVWVDWIEVTGDRD